MVKYYDQGGFKVENTQKALVSLTLTEIEEIKKALVEKINDAKDKSNTSSDYTNILTSDLTSNIIEGDTTSTGKTYYEIPQKSDNYSQVILETTIELNLYESLSWYLKAKKISHKVFKKCIYASLFGFIFIIGACVIFYMNTSTTRPFAASLAALVIIPNLVASLFFVLHRRASEQAQELLNNAKEYQDIHLANLYANNFPAVSDRTEIQKKE